MAINKRKILESAQKHLQRGALDKALEDYRILLKADPHDSNVLLKIGDLHLKQGKRDEAINSYLRVAQQFTREGFDAKAVALYKQITRLDPKRQDVCVPLAELYARMGLVNDAIGSLQGAADSAYRAGDKEGALELLRRMAALDPANTQNRLKVAELLAQEGRREEALSEYDAVVEELARRGEDEERIRVLERVLVIDPARTAVLREVAESKLAARDFPNARKLAERLLETHPEDLAGRELLGHALQGEGHEERARETFRELADLYRLRGDEGRARDLMQRFGGLEALAPEDTEVPLDADLPALELGTGDAEDEFLLEGDLPALPPAKRVEAKRTPPAPLPKSPAAVRPTPPPIAAEGEPAAPDQLLAEAAVYLRYGKHERAVTTLRAILAQVPDHRQALENLGDALAAVGETAHAVTALQRAAEGARAAADSDALARIRERLGRIDAAAAEALVPTAAASAVAGIEIDLDFDGALESVEAPILEAEADSDSLSFDLDGGFGEPLEGTPEPAPERPLASAPKASEDSSATTPGRVAADLEEAEFYFAQGLLDEARALYERILGAAPNHPQAMLRLGEITARSGGPPLEAAPAAAAGAPVPAMPREPAPATTVHVPDESAFEIELDLALPAGMEFDLAPQPAEMELDLAPQPAEMELDLAPRPAGMELDLAPRPAGMELDLAPQPVDLAPPPPEPPARARIAPADAPKLAADITQPSFAPEVEHEPGAFDLAAELSVAIGRDEPGLGTLAGTEEEGFEQVFEAFKSGIERELGDGDHEARYDLGIAYKEMGLLEDALAAFQIAMYAPARQLACLHMMGLCALELGRAADAVGHLEQALSLPDLPSDQRVPLRYDVGRAYAALGDKARARAAFEEVRAADPGFGEIERELAALEAGGETEASEEAYESFDDLISEGPAMATPTARYESFDDLFAEESASPSQASEELVSPSLAAVDLAEPEPDASADPQPEAEDAAPDETVGVEPPASPPPPTPARRRSKISFV